MDAPQVPAPTDDGWAEQFAETLRVQRARARDFLAVLAERQRRARAEFEMRTGPGQTAGTQNTPNSSQAIDRDELAALRQHRDRLEEKLSETESRLDQASERLEAMERRLAQVWRESPEPSDEPARDQSSSRQNPLEDLRRMRAQMEEAQRRPPERPVASVPRTAPPGGILDWEAEKRRIMAALEAEGEESDEVPKKPREEIEAVLRRTDVIVTDKEREISELKRLLEDQSANLGSVAVGAAALGGILDNDAIIQEERENLRRTQTEWQEKVRNAEIEISIERAKLARQRAEIEDTLRNQGDEAVHDEAAKAPPAKSDKAASGRWLTRLGLKDGKGA